jgi:hypothetical protein
MMIRYEFRRDRVNAIKNAKDADPQKIGEEVVRLTQQHGNFKPQYGVDAARNNPNHPMYHNLEWDNEIAGEKHRLDQVRTLVNSLRAIEVFDDGEEEEPKIAFVSVTADDGKRAYVPHTAIEGNRDIQKRVMQMALRDLEGWQRRYADLVEICDIVRAAGERLRDQLQQAELRPQ